MASKEEEQYKMESITSYPPVPPPKPGSHDASRFGTPTARQSARPAPLPTEGRDDIGEPQSSSGAVSLSAAEDIPDPGEHWLPEFLLNKSKQDLATILTTPSLLSALTHAPSTAHASTTASAASLRVALAENAELAARLADQAHRVTHARQLAQALLLNMHGLERAWRQKQSDMDAALAPFAPASLYQRLAQGVQEQSAVCRALEDSFLDGGGTGDSEEAEGRSYASEREVADWVRRYREQKKLSYLRQERKERWDEGRVGGWR